MTLIPVSKISAFGERSRKAGGSRWIGQRSPSARLLLVDGLAEHVPEPAERDLADRDADRRAGVDDVDAAREAVGGVHRDRTHAVVAEMLLHLRDQVERRGAVAAGDRDPERVVDLRERAREDGVDDDALHLDDLADVLLVSHWTPEEAVARRRRPSQRAGGRASARSLPKAGRPRTSLGRGPLAFVSAATRASWSYAQQYEQISDGITPA